ncbi:hypothetical protein SCA6_005640 [Theobroma cacao]
MISISKLVSSSAKNFISSSKKQPSSTTLSFFWMLESFSAIFISKKLTSSLHSCSLDSTYLAALIDSHALTKAPSSGFSGENSAFLQCRSNTLEKYQKNLATVDLTNLTRAKIAGKFWHRSIISCAILSADSATNGALWSSLEESKKVSDTVLTLKSTLCLSSISQALASFSTAFSFFQPSLSSILAQTFSQSGLSQNSINTDIPLESPPYLSASGNKRQVSDLTSDCICLSKPTIRSTR